MLYLYAEDEYYYEQVNVDKIKQQYDWIKEIVLWPDTTEIKEIVRKYKSGSTALLAPWMPSQMDPLFVKNGFFEIEYLKNRHGIRTTGQVRMGITEEEVLSDKLGIRIHKSTLSLVDYGGAGSLVEKAKQITTKERYGIPAKGYMIAGIPGTGKSFFAKCLAGELDRLLVELNLSLLMEQENTIFLVNMIFDFFQSHEGRYIIWIDEIEKMIVGDKAIQVLGVLLTRINDLNAEGKTNVFFVATANNLTGIAKKNPEFLRRGRFDELIFMRQPKENNDASSIFNIYIKKQIALFEKNILWKMIVDALNDCFEPEHTRARAIQQRIKTENHFKNLVNINEEAVKDAYNSSKEIQTFIESVKQKFKFSFPTNDFMRYAMVKYRTYAEPDRFIYTPAEVEFIVADMFFDFYFGTSSISDEMLFISESEMDDESKKKYQSTLMDLVERYNPLQVSLYTSIKEMSGIALNFDQV